MTNVSMVTMVISTVVVCLSIFSVNHKVSAFIVQPRLNLNTNIASSRNTPFFHILRSTKESNAGQKSQIQVKKIKTIMPNHDQHGPVQPIHSIDEFLDAIESAPQNGLVVSLFHAKWCKVCARVTIKLRQMAQRLQEKETSVPVSFISVEITSNNEICSTLGIKKFPFVQFYRNSECVASFGIGPAHNFQPAVGGTLDEKLSYSESQWEEFRSEFKSEIAEGLKSLESLRLSKFYDGDGMAHTQNGEGSVGP